MFNKNLNSCFKTDEFYVTKVRIQITDYLNINYIIYLRQQ